MGFVGAGDMGGFMTFPEVQVVAVGDESLNRWIDRPKREPWVL